MAVISKKNHYAGISINDKVNKSKQLNLTNDILKDLIHSGIKQYFRMRAKLKVIE